MNTTHQTAGVIIGRFQVPELHEGHIHLIETALQKEERLLILIGSRKGFPTDRNPLPYHLREAMIQKSYPEVIIRELPDQVTNESWSAVVDGIINDVFSGFDISLYASRDSFVDSYSGKHRIVLIPEIPHLSGSAQRKRIVSQGGESAEFRSGFIAAQFAREPISYQTVDIAVVRHGDQSILLGKKPGIDGLWLIGGFVDPKNSSLEVAAMRELSEEAGRLGTHELKYLGSYRMNDYRYRGEQDQMLTALFATYHLSGKPCAQDDIESVEWVPFRKAPELVSTEHRKLVERVIEFIENGR